MCFRLNAAHLLSQTGWFCVCFILCSFSCASFARTHWGRGIAAMTPVMAPRTYSSSISGNEFDYSRQHAIITQMRPRTYAENLIASEIVRMFNNYQTQCSAWDVDCGNSITVVIAYISKWRRNSCYSLIRRKPFVQFGNDLSQIFVLQFYFSRNNLKFELAGFLDFCGNGVIDVLVLIVLIGLLVRRELADGVHVRHADPFWFVGKFSRGNRCWIMSSIFGLFYKTGTIPI